MDASVFQVGILCALSLEYQAVLAIFDDEYGPIHAGTDPDIIYNIGRIGKHYTVAACLPHGRTGSGAASYLAGAMNVAFPSLQRRFLVGIAGGVPNEELDIRLGDVIIGTRIVQYDFGKTLPNGKFQRTREPFKAPRILPNALNEFKVRGNDQARQLIDQMMSTMKQRWPGLQNQWTYPGEDQDLLFEADYDHNIQQNNTRCEKCDKDKLVRREARDSSLPMFYDGLIASADQVMRDGLSRDLLKSDLTEILAVEMESAGLEDYGFIVIRGICDYADSHKNKQWQHYAAATAAACAKALLKHIPAVERYPDGVGTVPLPRRLTDTETEQASSRTAADRRDPSARSESQTAPNEPPFQPGDLHHRAQTFSVPGLRGDRTQEYSIATPQRFSVSDVGRGTFGRQFNLNNLENESAGAISSTTSGSLITSGGRTSVVSSLESYEIHRKVQLFSMPSIEYSATFLDRPDIQESRNPLVLRHLNSKMTLLQCVGHRYFEIDRRLFLQSPDPMSLWLPFDRVLVWVRGRVVKLKFSDCKAKHSETNEGRVRYSGSFDPKIPNVKISLTFPDDLLAQAFADRVLSSNCTTDYHRIMDIPSQSVRSSQDIDLRLYDCFETREPTEQTVDLLVIMTVVIENYKMSRAFFLGPYLDFEVETSDFGVRFHCLQNIQYLSPTDTTAWWPPRWVTENSEGKPQRIVLGKESDNSIRFLDESSYQNFMSAITGWQLKFTGDAKFRSCKKDTRLFTGSYHKAQVTLWLKTSESGPTKCHVITNLCKVQHNNNNWMSSTLKAPGRNIGTTSSSMSHNERNPTVVLNDVHVLEGPHIVRSAMKAGPPTEDRHTLYRQEFKFEELAISQQFADALARCIQAMSRAARPSESSQRPSYETY